MTAAGMTRRTVLLTRTGRLFLSGMNLGAKEILISMRQLAASHQKDGYRPKDGDMLETKPH